MHMSHVSSSFVNVVFYSSTLMIDSLLPKPRFYLSVRRETNGHVVGPKLLLVVHINLQFTSINGDVLSSKFHKIVKMKEFNIFKQRGEKNKFNHKPEDLSMV